jgi:hypothetical protein
VVSQTDERDFRSKVGLVGSSVSMLVFLVVLLGYCLLEASFRTWTVGKYFHNRAIIFADLFTIMAASSLITLIASCFARGKRRGAGVIFSVATIVFVVIIFVTNQ